LKFKRRSFTYIIVMGLLAFGLIFLNYQMIPKTQSKQETSKSADTLKAVADSLNSDSVR